MPGMGWYRWFEWLRNGRRRSECPLACVLRQQYRARLTFGLAPEAACDDCLVPVGVSTAGGDPWQQPLQSGTSRETAQGQQRFENRCRAPQLASHETVLGLPDGGTQNASHCDCDCGPAGTARKAGLPNTTNISLRPPEVAARLVFGYWKGNLIKHTTKCALMSMLVERIDRYVMLAKLNGNTGEDLLRGFKRRRKGVPESLRKAMTYDQGAQMALHQTLSAQLGIAQSMWPSRCSPARNTRNTREMSPVGSP